MREPDRREFISAAIAATAVPHTALAADQPHAGSITDVPGIRVGHITDKRRPTGCTAILFDSEASAGVDYDGSAPGSHLGVLLQPVSPIDTIHGILMTGGGPMGLAAVTGAVRYLEERRIGFDWGVRNVRVPIVVGAVIDDLSLGDGTIRPDAEAGYQACAAVSTKPVDEGNVGVGAGATVGKMLGGRGYRGMKSGLGTASLKLGSAVIGALVVVNASGDIIDRRSGAIVAGARRPDGQFANIVQTIASGREQALRIRDPALRSTTLALVATNINFSKVALTKIAMMASTGAARSINPYHTDGDGDSTFAVSTNKLKSDVSISAVGALAAELVSDAVVRAVKAAHSVEGWPAWRDLHKT